MGTHNVTWDACSKLLEVVQERLENALRSGIEGSNGKNRIAKGTSTLVADPAKAYEKVHFIVVWSWAMHCGFPQ